MVLLPACFVLFSELWCEVQYLLHYKRISG